VAAAPASRQAPPSPEAERQRCLAAILLRHPVLLRDVAEAWGQLDLPAPAARLRGAILDWFHAADLLDSTSLLDHVRSFGLADDVARALSAAPMPLPGCAAADATPAEAEAGWWELFGLSRPDRLDQELAEARDAFAANSDERLQRRLTALAIARNALRRGEADSEIDGEAGA
jgi:DNA primase